ncbi:hypothetical protein ILUMI_07382, partial [Ignelater luminosus]
MAGTVCAPIQAENDKETRVCERIDEVDCSKSEQFYSLNLELYGNTQPPILE